MVKDNKGNVVEVKPLDLVVGETVGTFEFVNSLSVAPKGVWTVEGISVDLDLKAKLKEVYESGSDQVKLNAAFLALGLTDVKSANITFYQAELAKVTTSTNEAYIAEEAFTTADAQAIIAAGNIAALKGADEAVIVKAVNEATTELGLLEALASFERVNSEWMTEYSGVIGKVGTPVIKTTAKEIQTEIDAQNKLKVDAVVNALKLDTDADAANVNKEKLTEAKAMVESFQKPDAEGDSAKSETLRKIDRQLAIVKVIDATSASLLSSAINGLSAVDFAFELSMDNFIPANRDAYITALGLKAAADKNTIAEINAILVVVNNASATKSLEAVVTAGTITTANSATPAQKTALLAALKAAGLKNVVDANKDAYATLGGASANEFGALTLAGTPAVQKAQVQALVEKANLAAINNAADADVAYAALVAYGNGIKDLSVSNKAMYYTDRATYITDKAAVQLAVDASNIKVLKAQTTAAGVLAKLQIMTQVKNVKAENSKAYFDSVGRNTTVGTDLGHADIDTIVEVQTAINALNALEVGKVGIKALNDATTAAEVKTALDNLAITEYVNVPSVDKLYIAEELLVVRNKLATKKFADLDAVKAALNTSGVITDYNTLVASVKFSALTDTSTTMGLLTALEYDAYDDLLAGKKSLVAEAFKALYQADKDNKAINYTRLADIKAGVDAAIEAVNAGTELPTPPTV